MEFKVKLQQLRINMKLSQEDLAKQLNVARQSVTKWENGQSFPDIQNLIQLSELFKVSIDRLVKEDEECTIRLFKEQSYSKEKIRLFLIRAKNSCYVTENNMIVPSRPNSHDYQYSEQDLLYRDTFLGSEQFGGEEAVWFNNTPIWMMNYYGHTLDEHFRSDFLKEALSLVSIEKPFRGPEYYQKGDYTYFCNVYGEFEHFHGEEEIFCKNHKVYKCMFHGGALL